MKGHKKANENKRKNLLANPVLLKDAPEESENVLFKNVPSEKRF